MRRLWIAAGIFFAWFTAFSQKTDSVFTNKKISKTDVQVLFSYYTQNGNNSAVTGGTGTEKLKVYAPNFNIKHSFDSLNTINLNLGVDVISSASTDNIDFRVSSASRLDGRGYSNLAYYRELPKSGFTDGGNVGLSIESDYFSNSIGLLLKHSNKDKSREISVDLQANFDDLRWGRVTSGLYRPEKLIYPKELRYREWYDTYKRNSYNFNFGIYQIINQRNTIAFYSGLTYQKGLLATPFHRVYFNDDITLRVENLPDERIKIPLGIQLNSFIGRGWILRSYYRYYYDTYKISAHTLDFESPVKLNAAFTTTPFVRLYTQTKSEYFKAFSKHNPADLFYTSDYDLSAFNSIKLGLGIRYAPYLKSKKGKMFNAIDVRYAYFHRSDGLQAHILSILFDYGADQKRR